MASKRHTPEQIVAKLRQVDVLTSQGTPVADAVRQIGVTEVTYGRAVGRRDLLLTAGGADPHRELAQALQHCPTACLVGLSPTGSRGVRARACRVAGCATWIGFAGHAPAGAQASPELEQFRVTRTRIPSW